MKAQASTASLALLLALACGQAAASTRPLELALSPLPSPLSSAQPARFARPLPAARPASAAVLRRGARPQDAALPNLRQRALQSVLDPPEPSLDEARADGRMQLHFHKSGNAFRDLNKSYRDMCNRVSAKVWDDPKGKRVRFDIAGKPGFAVEIPLH